MSYNNENYYKLREEYAEKPLRAIEKADARKAELRQKVKNYAELDDALAATASRIMGAAMQGREGLDERIAEIKQETVDMRLAMAELLKNAGYPADYADVHYECAACGDTGFIGTKMCSCFRRALTLRGYESAGVARLIATQSFDTFSLDYYRRDPQVFSRMQHNFETAQNFARSFAPKNSPSLLFIGGTGLGKTHLSSAIAKEVIDRGFDVLYDSAMHVFAAFENARFHGGADDTDRYLTVELLILDDLGTELGGAFTTACLYDIINTRLVRGLPTVMSTNLSAGELADRYGERIASRLFGEYTPLVFCGEDVRKEKIALR